MKPQSSKPKTTRPFRPLLMPLCLTLLATAPAAFAASQTWTNAPADTIWTNANNWVAKGIPGGLGIAGGTQNGDIVTFSNALSGTIGSGSNPILIDNAREVNSFLFDSANCGAYVIGIPANNQLWLTAAPIPAGNITMSPTVVNPINFLQEIHFHLASSQNGGYNMTNNATSPAATLYFDVLWADSASSRPVTLTLAGSNTGTNTVRHIDDNNAANGSIHLIKTGTGRWILPSLNDIPQKTSGGDNVPGSVAVLDGTLEVLDPAALGTITAANLYVTNTGILQIDGITLNNSGIGIRQGGTVRINGNSTLNSVIVGNTATTTGTLTTTAATDLMAVGIISAGQAAAVLHIAGPGTVQFNGANTYVGRYSIDAGTNQLTVDAFGTAANVTINPGAVLDFTPFGASTYAYDAKTFSANGTGTTVGSTAAAINQDPGGTVAFGTKPITFNFTPTSFSGDTTHPALYCLQGAMSFNGNTITVNNASGTPLGVGSYTLATQASGTITSSGAFVTLITGSGLGAGLIGEIVASGANLNLVVTAYTPKSLVWTGGDIALPQNWDRQTTFNWLAGATKATFNIYDSVIFNCVGSTNPTVNLAATMVPSSVTVDTSCTDYTFSGAGQIAGGSGLLKISPGNLFLNIANTYSGGTVISNGVIKLGIDNAISGIGAGDVTNVSPGTIDLNGWVDSIGALNGNGTVDITSGGVSTLTIGDNDNTGTFAGVIQNTSGTLSVTKVGLGSETLTRSNSYTGATDLELGTFKVTDPNGIGAGLSAMTINGGTLDMATNLTLASLAGAGGTIANNSTTSTNTLTITGSTVTTYAGSIVNGSTGRIALKVLGGTLRLNGANTYTNGTIVGSGATFQLGNSPSAITGALIASNTATLGLSGGSSSPGTPTSVTTVDGASITLTSGAEGEIWTGQFLGNPGTTNRFTGPVSAGGIASFSNFLGVVQFALASGNFRFFNGAGVSGGDNTTFEFDAGNVHTRDAQTVSLGSIQGGSSTAGIGGNGTGGTISTWTIGAKNVNNNFEGYINGTNNLVKAGTASLTLDGAAVVTNTDSLTYTNYLISPVISFLGTTTVSNGVLALVAPNTLSNSTSITLATVTAVLDVSQMGYVSNQLSVDDGITPTNSYLVTNGVLQIQAVSSAGPPQLLAGFGTIKGSGVISAGTINPGSSIAGGTLSISNGLTILAGATNYFDLSDDLTGLVKPSDMITVQGNVTLSGSSVIGIGALNGVVKQGKYTLIKYTGNLVNESGIVGLGPISNFALGGLFPATSRATLVLSNAPGEVDLVVVSLNTQNLTWAGDGSSNFWDVVTSFNWTNTTVPIQFYQLDFVTFDNSSTNLVVNLQGTLVPSAILVNSTFTNTFGGPGSISGTATLTKTGTGTLILTNAGNNTFSGGTILSNGVLNVGSDSGGNQNDRGLGYGPVTVNAGSELRFGGNTGAVVSHYITNVITINGGVVKAQDGLQHLTNSTITVTAAGGTLQTVFATKNLVFDSPLTGPGNVTISVPATFAGGQVVLSNANNTISGAVAIATNGNLAMISSAGLSNTPSIDVQQGGFLDATLRTGNTWTLQSGQTLMGNGVIRVKTMNLAAGSVLSPGANLALGTLTITNTLPSTNFTTVTFGGTTIMELNRAGTPNNSDRFVTSTNVFGGTLTVNNLGAAPILGDTFTLFTSITNLGTFAVTNLPVLGAGLGWSNSVALNGKLTVIAVITVNTNAFTLTNSVNGNTLTLSWPLDHTGYRLLVQTNTLSTGLIPNTNAWFTVTGSTTTNSMPFIINRANATVFYRLIYP